MACPKIVQGNIGWQTEVRIEFGHFRRSIFFLLQFTPLVRIKPEIPDDLTVAGLTHYKLFYPEQPNRLSSHHGRLSFPAAAKSNHAAPEPTHSPFPAPKTHRCDADSKHVLVNLYQHARTYQQSGMRIINSTINHKRYLVASSAASLQWQCYRISQSP